MPPCSATLRAGFINNCSSGTCSVKLARKKDSLAHPADEIFALESQVELGSRLHRATARPQLALQIVVDLLIDDRFGAQPAITVFLEPGGHACQKL